jgi:hypothetical protein
VTLVPSQVALVLDELDCAPPVPPFPVLDCPPLPPLLLLLLLLLEVDCPPLLCPPVADDPPLPLPVWLEAVVLPPLGDEDELELPLEHAPHRSASATATVPTLRSKFMRIPPLLESAEIALPYSNPVETNRQKGLICLCVLCVSIGALCSLARGRSAPPTSASLRARRYRPLAACFENTDHERR